MTSPLPFLTCWPKAAQPDARAPARGFHAERRQAPGDSAMQELIADVDFAISGQVGVSGDVLKAAKRLKLLHKWGVGVDNIDVETARSLGIKVARTTASKRAPRGRIHHRPDALDAALHSLRPPQPEAWRLARAGQAAGETFLLSSKTVGIVGLGAIGANVARLLRASAAPSSMPSARRSPPPRNRRSASAMPASTRSSRRRM